MKQFGEKKRSCQASWFNNFSWFHYSKEKDSVFCIFCIRHKVKLTAERNMEEALSRRGLIIGRKLLKHLLITKQPEAHRAAITYEFVVLQCGDVLEMTVNDLNNKRLTERKYLIKVMECIRFLVRQGLAFRGNDDNDDLTQLFKLLIRKVILNLASISIRIMTSKMN